MNDFNIPVTTDEKLEQLALLKNKLNAMNGTSSLKRPSEDWMSKHAQIKANIETYFANIISTLSIYDILAYYIRAQHFKKAIPQKGQLAILDKLLSKNEFNNIYKTLTNQNENLTNLNIKFIKVCLEFLKLENEVSTCGKCVTKYKKCVIEFAERFHFDPNLWLDLIEMG